MMLQKPMKVYTVTFDDDGLGAFVRGPDNDAGVERAGGEVTRVWGPGHAVDLGRVMTPLRRRQGLRQHDAACHTGNTSTVKHGNCNCNSAQNWPSSNFLHLQEVCCLERGEVKHRKGVLIFEYQQPSCINYSVAGCFPDKLR